MRQLDDVLRETPWHKRLLWVLTSALVHVVFFWVLTHLPAPKLVGEGGDERSVRVRVDPAKPLAPVVPLPPRRATQQSRTLVKRGPTSQTAPRVPVPTPKDDERIEERRNERERNLDNASSKNEPDERQTPVAESALPSSTFNPGLSRLLPNGNWQTRELQRNQGRDQEGESQSAETWPRRENPNPPRDRPNIVATEFNTLAYRMELERRFAQAWGPTRILPYGSTFVGTPGELINYNLVINRDGSLRRLVNVSALEQPNRDFSSVDTLVREFASVVFPMNPLPDRLKDDPFIYRWSILFSGYQYFFN